MRPQGRPRDRQPAEARKILKLMLSRNWGLRAGRAGSKQGEDVMSDLTATGGVTGPGRIGRVAIGDILRRAARRDPDRVALTDGARRVTFTEIDRDANRFANYLVARGLKPGDKISTICNNSAEFVKALFGIHRAGLVWVPINTMLGAGRYGLHPRPRRVRFALIDDNLHAQPDGARRWKSAASISSRVDLAGKAPPGSRKTSTT
jgi:long-chain acyl-CoA synthetase